MPTPEWRPEQLPQERVARWNRNTFPGGVEGMAANPSPTYMQAESSSAETRGAVSGAAAVLFAYDYMIVP
jgi:hypothetical protein